MLGINRSSVFRLANTLCRRGFLSTPNGRNEYVIGRSIWRLFQNYDWSTLITFSRPYLKQLAAQTGETAHLAVREGKQALFVDHETSGNRIIAVSGRTGEFMPLRCTAHAKALLADCTPAELSCILGTEPLERHSAHTIAAVEDLLSACSAIRQNGYTIDEGEFLNEVRASLLPFATGRMPWCPAIGISAPLARVSNQRLPHAIQSVIEAARARLEVSAARGL